MGSGTNRAWWKQFGSRSGRRAGTKSGSTKRRKPAGWLKAHARRAEAKRRSSHVVD